MVLVWLIEEGQRPLFHSVLLPGPYGHDRANPLRSQQSSLTLPLRVGYQLCLFCLTSALDGHLPVRCNVPVETGRPLKLVEAGRVELPSRNAIEQIINGHQ
jgi:hypothetical protein